MNLLNNITKLQKITKIKNFPFCTINTISLNTLKDNKGAKKNEIRVGRGRSGRRGKTCGRGLKGTKARSGGSVRNGFEGGQTPIYRRLPKIGFKAPYYI